MTNFLHPSPSRFIPPISNVGHETLPEGASFRENMADRVCDDTTSCQIPNPSNSSVTEHSDEDFRSGSEGNRPNSKSSTVELNSNPFEFHCPERISGAPAELVATMNDWHFPMLADTQRLEFFETGLRGALKRIDRLNSDKPFSRSLRTVFDLGSGSGLLSLLAIRAGFDLVFAVEGNRELCEKTLEICEKNDIRARLISGPKLIQTVS